MRKLKKPIHNKKNRNYKKSSFRECFFDYYIDWSNENMPVLQ